MPAADLAAKRYAQAAFDLASRDGSFDEWASALGQIGAFMSETDIKRALESTRFSQENKQRLVDAGLRSLPRLPLNLARLLARKGRTALAPDIASEFGRLVQERQGVARARALTAVPLSELEKDGLARRLEQQTGLRIVLETEVDPNLLGGVVIQIGDRLVDASTKARLASLRESLVGAVG
jgi:F-type H+-transporting ATPase subunit delta